MLCLVERRLTRCDNHWVFGGGVSSDRVWRDDAFEKELEGCDGVGFHGW